MISHIAPLKLDGASAISQSLSLLHHSSCPPRSLHWVYISKWRAKDDGYTWGDGNCYDNPAKFSFFFFYRVWARTWASASSSTILCCWSWPNRTWCSTTQCETPKMDHKPWSPSAADHPEVLGIMWAQLHRIRSAFHGLRSHGIMKTKSPYRWDDMIVNHLFFVKGDLSFYCFISMSFFICTKLSFL